jgi:GR25 family glycosyltransferase involved in LPS biosynthesis
MDLAFFDSIICINLRERSDKRVHATTVLRKLDIPFVFFTANKHLTSGRIGCFESHLKVIQRSYDLGYKNILVFEDDLKPTLSCSNPAVFNNAIDHIKKNPGCMYYQLGYTVLPHDFARYATSRFLSKNTLDFVGNTTHAYILTRQGMKRVLESKWEDKVYNEPLHLDIFFTDLFRVGDESACVCPMLFDQEFCLENNNDTPTTQYYKMLRMISCIESKMSIVYCISLAKRHSMAFVVAILVAIAVWLHIVLQNC